LLVELLPHGLGGRGFLFAETDLSTAAFKVRDPLAAACSCLAVRPQPRPSALLQKKNLTHFPGPTNDL
jgi:hypothetical protein